jgi:hypothetical protein
MGYVLAGTFRQLGTRTSLLLTLTDIETGKQVWSGRQRPPFDGLIQGFDHLVSQIARRDRIEFDPARSNLHEGAAAPEQDERIRQVRERARRTHNAIVKKAIRPVRNRTRKRSGSIGLKGKRAAT